MSGPVRPEDVSPDRGAVAEPSPATVEVTDSRLADVGGMPVRRALPRRGRRTVGAWCFVDHFGPTTATAARGVEIGPHPHIGLQTVTWVLEGRQVHRDSLGSEQVIRPGQLNLMTAAHGVVHAEETLDYTGPLHGVQLWVAQPESTRHGAAAFEHHPDLPCVELASGTATVLVGTHGGEESKARADTPLVGLDLALGRGTSPVETDPAFEYALVVISGVVDVDGIDVPADSTAYLGTARDEVDLTARAGDARALLLGGAPFESPVLMWWNFVGRTQEEMTAAYDAWTAGDARFGPVATDLPRIPAPVPPWPAR